MSTAVTACRIGWVAYVIPFVFVFAPELIMKGSAVDVIVSFAAALIGVWIVSAGLLGYLFQRLNAPLRVLFFLAGIALLLPAQAIPPGLIIKAVGAIAAILLVGREVVARRNGRLANEAAAE